MRTLLAVIVCLTACSSLLQAESKREVPSPTAYRVVGKGANHRVWQRETFEKAPDGAIVSRVQTYTELASGMNYQNTRGEWVGARESVELFPQGAVARRGQYQVIFANNINTFGAIDMQTPDGKRIRSNVLGIGYSDNSTGQGVMIAEIKDSFGEVVGRNQVIYTDAFDGVDADVRYVYKKSGFEQDIILKDRPPTPESFGLNPATTKLIVFTEFIDPPQASVTVNMDDTGTAQDEQISWGVTRIGHGRAFDISREVEGVSVAVEKRYVTVAGRKVLIEMVPLRTVSGSLNKLPTQSSIQKPRSATMAKSEAEMIPPVRAKNSQPKPMKLAAALPPSKGYVLDYVTLNVNLTNFTFQGDTTYKITGDVNLAGTTTIEGGTVIKLDTNATCSINILGSLNCKTAPYLPAVFTSADDSTIGENVGGSSSYSANCVGEFTLEVINNSGYDLIELWNGYDENWYEYSHDPISNGNSDIYVYTTSLSQYNYVYAVDTYYANYFFAEFYPSKQNGTLTLNDDWTYTYTESGDDLCTIPPPPPPPTVVALSLANGGDLHDVRFKHVALGVHSTANYTVQDAQFVRCGTALKSDGATLYAGNVLIGNVDTAFSGQSYSARVENLTFDQGLQLATTPTGMEGLSQLNLTNSLLTGVSSMGNVIVHSNFVASLASNSGVYQVAGGGSYYLATNSPYRDVGSSSIDPNLLYGLRVKTTFSPIIYSSTTLATSKTYDLQAGRDTNAIDLGYHYDPIDYCFGSVVIQSNVTFNPGTVAGFFYNSSGGSWAMSLNANSTVSFSGTALLPTRWTKWTTVQEGANGSWGANSWLGGITGGGISTVRADFTIFTEMSGDGNLLRDSGALIKLIANYSEAWVGSIGGYSASYCLTNCLLVENYVGLWNNYGSANLAMQNCTMIKGVVFASGGNGQSWPLTIKNCAFDGTAFWLSRNGALTNTYYTDYNAFLLSSNRTLYTGGHDLTITNGYNWQSSWLGNYYLPSASALINAGNTNANLLGLYHFTTQTNQVKEAASAVDIGYHYVATDENGWPVDTDGDGTPDYIEDTNGNGIFDGSDFGDWLISAYNGLSRTNGLRVFTPLK